MANNYKTLGEEVLEKALCVCDGMDAVFDDHTIVPLTGIRENCVKFDGCYSFNNSTIAFFYKHNLYVAPYTRALDSALSYANFKQESFYVPFSNWDYPKAYQFRWFMLRNAARQARQTSIS